MRDVPKIVVNRLQELAADRMHPEAEMLAAFAEQLLPPSERTLVINHLGSCAECRQVMVLAMPAAAELVVKVRGARGGWLSWPVLRWGFASATILALISVGILEYEHRDRGYEEIASRSARAASAENQGVSQVPEQSHAVQPAQQSAVRRQTRISGKGLNALHDDQTARVAGDLKASAGSGPVTDRLQSLLETTTAAQNQPPDQLIQHQSERQSYASSDVVKAKAAVVPQSPSGPVASSGAPNISPQMSPSVLTGVSTRWAISAAGGLQRSSDAGKTWADVDVIPATGKSETELVFRSVAAIGSEVWAGGSSAVLYHSGDAGARWQKVFPSTAGATPTGDINQIDIFDRQGLTISTSTGETWTTSDGGKSWQRQQ